MERPDPSGTGPWGGAAPRLLVSSPRLNDPNFERSIVLLLEDGPQGAVGLVLNRPLHVPVAEVLPRWADQAALAPPATMFRGGPVSPDAVIGLGRRESGAAPPATAMSGGVQRVVVGPVAVVDLTESPWQWEGVRLFAGYAGWSAGQLAEEIARGAWFEVAVDAGDVLSDDPPRLWHDILRRQGGSLSMLANFPPHPSRN